MVIHHFNRIIRNKWIWGVFAVAISVFFAFDFLFTGGGDESRSVGGAGKLGAEDLDGNYFRALTEDVRGFGRARDRAADTVEVNKEAWRNAAALAVAKSLKLTATDDEIREAISRDPSFKGANGAFDIRRYELLLRENGMTPELFESFLQRRLTLTKLSRVVLGSAAWVSPMELEGAINDVTDKFTVKIAYFTDTEAGKVKLDDKGLEAYYKDNTNSIALPDLMKVRYVKFQADAAARLAGFKVTDDELHDHYDATSSRFETQTTNGVITKKFEEVKGILEHELKVLASVEAYRTNLLFRAYPPEQAAAADGKKEASKLDAIAKQDGLKVQTSPFFTAGEGKFVAGFMARPNWIAPGVEGFAAAAAELDSESADLRYGVVAGTNVVYLIERAEFAKAHVPSFKEAKDVIRPAALQDARAKAFKAAVEKKRALAAAALAKGGTFDAKTIGAQNVTTAMVFSVSALTPGAFADSRYVAQPAMKLAKGQISEFIETDNPARGLLVYMEKREVGDAASAQMVRAQLRDELSSMTASSVARDWMQWNLDRIGYETTEISSVKAPDESALSED